MYTQEKQDQKLKLDKLVANSPDEWDTKNSVRFPTTCLTLPTPLS